MRGFVLNKRFSQRKAQARSTPDDEDGAARELGGIYDSSHGIVELWIA
jgi:hypothetical protein